MNLGGIGDLAFDEIAKPILKMKFLSGLKFRPSVRVIYRP